VEPEAPAGKLSRWRFRFHSLLIGYWNSYIAADFADRIWLDFRMARHGRLECAICIRKDGVITPLALKFATISM
jgi:hypothetical protein